MIPRFVLTGGPCGGKSTAIEYLKKSLLREGIVPIFVPEMATMMFNSGIKWIDISKREQDAFRFQVTMIKSQIQNEDMIYSFAHLVPGKNKVMICDRGTVDNMVYAKDEWHDDILSQVGSLGYLKRRYDGIIHLNTLAWGDGFSNENNLARHEKDKEAAIAVDVRTWEMWSKGPEVPHIRISHTISLDEKMKMVSGQIIEFTRNL